MRITIDLPDQLVDQLTALNCGDNSCLYRDRTKNWGVGTNGGCRCLKDLRSDVRFPVQRLLDRAIGAIWDNTVPPTPEQLRERLAEVALDAAAYDAEGLVREDVTDAGGDPLCWKDANDRGKRNGYTIADAILARFTVRSVV